MLVVSPRSDGFGALNGSVAIGTHGIGRRRPACESDPTTNAGECRRNLLARIAAMVVTTTACQLFSSFGGDHTAERGR
jgi:hypothetical protein